MKFYKADAETTTPELFLNVDDIAYVNILDGKYTAYFLSKKDDTRMITNLAMLKNFKRFRTNRDAGPNRPIDCFLNPEAIQSLTKNSGPTVGTTVTFKGWPQHVVVVEICEKVAEAIGSVLNTEVEL
jgi:hypothetical protein